MALHTPYYHVQLAQSLPSDEWFAVVHRLKRYMGSHGFEIDEFGDSSPEDREAVQADGTSSDFEGQIIFPLSPEWKTLLRTFFVAEGLPITKIEMQDIKD